MIWPTEKDKDWNKGDQKHNADEDDDDDDKKWCMVF